MNEKELNELYYPGNDLGANYTKKKTTFALWAPTAKEVSLKIRINGNFQIYFLKKDGYHVYRIEILGNLLNAPYSYIIKHADDTIVETIDPYGKSVTLNSEFSAVVDTNRVKNSYHNRVRKNYKNYTVIYEVGVRDFTEDKHTNIVNKGKFLGFIEKGKTTGHGNKAGLDYLIDLGISHVQLNPVCDFANVDDIKLDTYNWGYDPISYFALEGSLSTAPEIPLSRMLEFKKMVSVLHKNDIRVILDVVYNHVYKHETSCYEKVVPGYYFRKNREGKAANGSGCGNELATEKPMVRKMVLDSIAFLMDTYDVDGFRFDLMGLIDVETMNQIEKLVMKKKKHALLYGEGWNMGDALPYEARASTDNASKLGNIGFFQAEFRDALNGNVFDINSSGYLMGNSDLAKTYVYCNSSSRYGSPSRCVNYVECHDNSTLFDRISSHYKEERDDEILRRVNLGNALTVLTFGNAFVHMGQEIGQSKQGLNNTYNVRKINNLSYALVDERTTMLNYFKDLVAFRKTFTNYSLKHPNPEDIIYDDIEEIDGLLICKIRSKKVVHHFKKIVFVINPTSNSVPYQLDDYYYSILSSGGLSYNRDMAIKNAVIPPVSVIVVGK